MPTVVQAMSGMREEGIFHPLGVEIFRGTETVDPLLDLLHPPEGMQTLTETGMKILTEISTTTEIIITMMTEEPTVATTIIIGVNKTADSPGQISTAKTMPILDPMVDSSLIAEMITVEAMKMPRIGDQLNLDALYVEKEAVIHGFTKMDAVLCLLKPHFWKMSAEVLN